MSFSLNKMMGNRPEAPPKHLNQLLLFGIQNTHRVLVGGNHTAARFCTRYITVSNPLAGAMGAKFLQLELLWKNALGKRILIRCMIFSILLALMPILYIIQVPCELADESKLFFGLRVPRINYNAEFYSAIYGNLINQGLLCPGLKGLCVGAGAWKSAYALRSEGLPGAVIDCRCDLLRFPFADASFDFVYSGWSWDRARAPALHAMEIERTLKPGGLAIVFVVSPRRFRQDSNLIHSVTPIAALFRNAGVAYLTSAGNSSLIVLRKRVSSDLEFINLCGKHNRTIISLAESPTQNHTTAIYLPKIIDITSHNRHFFVEVGFNSSSSTSPAAQWFLETYPKQNKEFHVRVVDINNKSISDFSTVDSLPCPAAVRRGRGHGFEHEVGARETVRKEDFIVVKADSESVRKMIVSGAICLVDEIFVICNQNNPDADCTQLLIKLRKSGVFAHKW